MSRTLIIGWVVASTLVAHYLGKRIGVKYLRGRINDGWMLALVLVLGPLIGWILLGALRIPIEYIVWVGVLVGAIWYGAGE